MSEGLFASHELYWTDTKWRELADLVTQSVNWSSTQSTVLLFCFFPEFTDFILIVYVHILVFYVYVYPHIGPTVYLAALATSH